MGKMQKSKRIKELEDQLQKFIYRVQHPEGKSLRERLKEIKRLRGLYLQAVLQSAMEFPTREEAKAYLEKQKVSLPTKGAILLESEIDPPPEGYLTGEDALAAVSYPPKKYYDAVRHYSADTDHPNSYYRLINTSLRSQEDQEDHSLTDPNVIQTMNDLTEMFKEVEPLKKPVRLYRGIPTWVAEKILEVGIYSDKGFSSCSSDLGVAVAYSGVSKEILVIDVQDSFKGFVKISDWSRNPHEREVLLQNNKPLFMSDSKMTKDGFRLIYVTN